MHVFQITTGKLCESPGLQNVIENATKDGLQEGTEGGRRDETVAEIFLSVAILTFPVIPEYSGDLNHIVPAIKYCNRYGYIDIYAFSRSIKNQVYVCIGCVNRQCTSLGSQGRMRRRLLNSILLHDDLFINLKRSRRYMSDFKLLELDKYKQLDDTEIPPTTNSQDSKIYKKFIIPTKHNLKKLNTTNYSVNRLAVQDIKSTKITTLNQDITTSLTNCLKLMKINSETDNNDPFSFKITNNNITKLKILQDLNIPIISDENGINKKKLKNLPDIIPVEPMKFNESDFEISDSTLRKYPFNIAVSNNPLINKETEPVKTYKRLKGVSYELYKIAFSSVSKPIFKSNLFYLTYYHPNHFISKIRKSKPGIWISAQTNLPYNNETLITKGKNSNSNSNSNNNLNKSPFKLAVNRTKLRKLTKKLFFKNYLELNAPDGFYNFKFKKFPKDEKDQELLKLDIKKALNQIKSTDINIFLNAVKFADNRIDWKLVDSTCKKFQLSKILPQSSINKNNKKRK